MSIFTAFGKIFSTYGVFWSHKERLPATEINATIAMGSSNTTAKISSCPIRQVEPTLPEARSDLGFYGFYARNLKSDEIEVVNFLSVSPVVDPQSPASFFWAIGAVDLFSCDYEGPFRIPFQELDWWSKRFGGVIYCHRSSSQREGYPPSAKCPDGMSLEFPYIVRDDAVPFLVVQKENDDHLQEGCKMTISHVCAQLGLPCIPS